MVDLGKGLDEPVLKHAKLQDHRVSRRRAHRDEGSAASGQDGLACTLAKRPSKRQTRPEELDPGRWSIWLRQAEIAKKTRRHDGDRQSCVGIHSRRRSELWWTPPSLILLDRAWSPRCQAELVPASYLRLNVCGQKVTTPPSPSGRPSGQGNPPSAATLRTLIARTLNRLGT